MTQLLDTLVIGGGPAGLMAAKYLAANDFKCEVLEFLPSPGRKLLASGAGKCNVTNCLTFCTITASRPSSWMTFIIFPSRKKRPIF